VISPAIHFSLTRHSPRQSTKTPMLTPGVGGVTPVTSSWDLDGGSEMQLGAEQMGTQETQIDPPGSSATEPPRSRKLVALISGAAVMVILAVIGVYYVAFRSLPTTVSWAPSVAAMASGGDLTAAGQITPADGGRKVSIQSAPNTQGPWQLMPPTVTTDSRGRFTTTFTPQFSGSIVMRVVVDPAGRYLRATGEPVRIRSLSSISLKGGGTIPTQTSLSFTVAVDPSSAGRTVRIEQSSDKVRWVPVGTPVQTKADGAAVVNVPSPAVGVWSYRAKVAQDNNYAAAVSPVVGATVEDIKAAAATYLRITNEYNAAVDTFNKARTSANASPGTGLTPASLRSAAGALSSADTKAATQLRAYGPWPQSVKPLIDQIIAQYVIEADNMHQLSRVTNIDSWNTVGAQGQAANVEGARLSVLIRQALGLPQRSIE